MTVRIPRYLHDVFGESQTVGELLAIVLVGLGGATGLFLASPAITQGQSSWRSAIALLLVADIFAGCVANFTRSTNDYYAARGKHRLVFIAIHVHVLVVAWLLGLGFWGALVVWGYTIAGALTVNALKASQLSGVCGRGAARVWHRIDRLGDGCPNVFPGHITAVYAEGAVCVRCGSLRFGTDGLGGRASRALRLSNKRITTRTR